ncbi:hypothetical protein CFIMG_003432RA [Ceratocystis fimbriata CBS 114723]|uniref:Uncharacterized protein n=1 Tax=Ceratocystis fimbriata CBS 114723 TaxID=1035309 RepID=A0A2C5XDP3_9PEZI|nr:hypothetical protein CFIMG_003432RA [Ceratocystis fimbriata CBS 114723]
MTRGYTLSLLLGLASLAVAQCPVEPNKLVCYDYPGAVTQDLDVIDVQTISWYLRWYSHTEGNPLFWTMYTTDNETTASVPLNDTSLASLTPGSNSTTPSNTTLAGGIGIDSSSNAIGNSATLNNSTTANSNITTAQNDNSGPLNSTAPYLNLTTPTALPSSSRPNVVHTFSTMSHTAAPTAVSQPPVAADQCLEWTVITRGTVMLLARLSGTRNASVLYDDIAYSLDGITGDWGKWIPRSRGTEDEQKVPVLIDCNNSGGQVPVYVNKTNPAYHSEEFLEKNYSTEGIWLKLVHTPPAMEMGKRSTEYGEPVLGHI